MWTRIAFLLIALAAASAEYGWKSGQTYTYEVTSTTLTGLHTAPQYSGLVVKSKLAVYATTEQELIAVIEHAEKAQIHARLQKGHEFDIPKEMLKYQPFTLTKQPFVIRLKEGIVHELEISKEVPIWEVNVIKSIVSQLQVDTQGKRIIPSKLNMIPQENELTAVYKVMEDTVEGECEVLYDITPLPKYIVLNKPYLAPLFETVKEEHMINVVKTKNFTNCEHRPGYHYGITGMTHWEPTTNYMGDFLSRSSVGRVILSGNLKSYTIHSSLTTNKVTLKPESGNQEIGTVLSRVNLTLVSVTPSKQQVEKVSNPQSIKKLVYYYNNPTATDEEARQKWDRINELPSGRHGVKSGKNRYVRSITQDQYSGESSESSSISVEQWHQDTPKLTSAVQNPFLPYTVGCNGHSIKHCQNVDVVQVVKKLCEQIGAQLEEPNHVPQTNTLERFSILIKVIRNLDAEQLRKVTEELWVKKEEGTTGTVNPRRVYWMTFRDAVAQAGTGPALVTIKEWILNDKIHGEEAAQVVASLTESAMHPTPEYMKTFFELVKNQKVLQQQFLNTTAIYSFTKLVRLAQVDHKAIHNRYPVHSFGRFTPLKDSVVAEEYIPYFGSQLQKAVQEQDSVKIQVYIRALGNMGHPKILAVLEPYLEGQLPLTDFQRTLVVVSLNDLAKTHHRIARSVLYKIFSNIGEIHQVRVAALYNLMRTVPPVNMLQRIAEASYYDPSIQVRSAIKSAIESAALLKSPVNAQLCQNAKAAVNMLTPEVFGVHYSRKNLTDFVFQGLNVGYTDVLSYIGSEDSIFPSALFYGIKTQIHGFQRKYFKVGAMVSSVQDLIDFFDNTFSITEDMDVQKDKPEEWTYEKITKTLNIEHELMKQIEGNVLYKLAGAERYFTFDNHTIESALEKLFQLPYTLTTGYASLYQKMYNSHNIEVGFPTVTGFPFVYTLDTPRMLYGKSKIQLKMDNTPKTTGTKNVFGGMGKFGGLINLQGVYSSRTQSNIGFVTPFEHRVYLSTVKEEHQTNIPIRMEFDVNLHEKRVKLELQPFDKAGDLKVFQYNTEQHTSIVDITEFKPIVEGSNTKKVNARETEKYQRIFGEEGLLGVRVEVETQKRHFDLKTLQMALQRHSMISPFIFPTIGEKMVNTKVNVYYDKNFARSAVFNFGIYQTLRSGKAAEKAVVPTPRQGIVQEVVTQIQQGVKSPEAVVIELECGLQGQKNVKYMTVLGYGYSPVAEEKRLVLRYQKTGDKAYELCFNGATKMPFVPETDFTKALQNQPKGQVAAELRFGENGCKDGAQVALAGKFERTPERTEYLKKLPQVASCNNEMKDDNKLLSGCMNATYNANLLNRYTFSVKYDKVPVTAKNMTYQIYSFFRHLGYSFLSENVVHPENVGENKIDMDVHFSPDLKSVTAQLSSPVGVAQFKNVRVNKYFRTALVLHPNWNVARRFGWSALRQQYKSFCTVDKTKTRTFDNMTYPIHLINQWIPVMVSVPKIDQENQLVGVHKVAILAKQVSGDKKEVLISVAGAAQNSGIDLHIKPEGGITINGKTVEYTQHQPYEFYDKKGQLIVMIYPLVTGEVKLIFPECNFELLYGTSRFQVVAGQCYKNRILGLCGDYNGEKFDFVTPKGKYIQKPEEFVASWALTNEGPYAELKSRVEKNSVRKTVFLTGVVSDQDAGRTDKRGRQYTKEQQLRGYYETSSSSSSESAENDSECLTKRIIVVEREGKYCFSTEPQSACKQGCQVEKTAPETARFVCVNKSQTSDHWARMVTRGVSLPKLGEKSNVLEIPFQAPVECTRN